MATTCKIANAILRVAVARETMRGQFWAEDTGSKERISSVGNQMQKSGRAFDAEVSGLLFK